MDLETVPVRIVPNDGSPNHDSNALNEIAKYMKVRSSQVDVLVLFWL